ncbi:hypothetical protein [Amycolatopsis sp. cmx-4-54]|uniref:AbiTii domain-containing protein n=1 Tax=Amycolatopsis sp. cmx-4-54 TaxID=2790936 RepID=UPI00397A33E5
MHALGGQAGSVKLRDWARQELNGYSGEAEIPDYRTTGSQLMARITNRAGRNAITQELYEHVFPEQLRELLPPSTS